MVRGAANYNNIMRDVELNYWVSKMVSLKSKFNFYIPKHVTSY